MRGLSARNTAWALALSLVGGCASESELTITTVLLHVADDPTCRPLADTERDRVEVRALGDFSAAETFVRSLIPGEPSAIDLFPPETRLLAFESTGSFRAGAVVPVSAGELDALLLPFGRPCALSDPMLALAPGGVAAALPGGGLMLAGGLREGEAQRQLVRLDLGRQAGVMHEELRLRRVGATATYTSGFVVLVGGAQDEGGSAHDTVGLYDVATLSVEVGASNLASPRRDHGATRLPDGSVLVAGGVSEAGGPPLRSAERIAPADFRVQPAGELVHARVAPTVLTLDDGTALIVGGVAADGSFVPEIEIFDPNGPGFVAPKGELWATRLPLRDDGVAVALPGARFAWVGVDTTADEPSTEITILHRRGVGEIVFLRTDLSSRPPLPPMERLAATTLEDGALLVTGQDRLGGDRAFVVDLSTGSSSERPAASAPAALLALADGTIAELSSGGLWLRRELLRTAFDNPPATLLAGFSEGVALDAPDHWSARVGGFVPEIAAARIDLPGLSFADFSLELDAVSVEHGSMHIELLLLPELAPPIPIVVEDNEVRLDGCRVDRAPEAPLRLVRRGDGITLDAGRGQAACALPTRERLALAIRADPGTFVRALRNLQRVGPN